MKWSRDYDCPESILREADKADEEDRANGGPHPYTGHINEGGDWGYRAVDCESKGDFLRYRASHVMRELSKAVPRHFQSATTEEAVPERGVYLWGGVGVGKTHRAAAWALRAMHAGATVSWVSVPRYLTDLKASFNGGPGPDDVETIAQSDLVVLDDIGAEKATEWVRETLLVLIDELYVNDKFVICTSNVKISQLERQLGKRSASRLAELCDLREIGGNDRRITIAHERGAAK